MTNVTISRTGLYHLDRLRHDWMVFCILCKLHLLAYVLKLLVTPVFVQLVLFFGQ